MGTYTVGLSSTNSSGSSTSTSQTLAATDVAPTPTISGLPASGAVNQAYTLVASVTDPVPSDTAAGFNDVWSVSAGPGQQAVAASNLVFNGSNPIALPSGLIHNATSLDDQRDLRRPPATASSSATRTSRWARHRRTTRRSSTSVPTAISTSSSVTAPSRRSTSATQVNDGQLIPCVLNGPATTSLRSRSTAARRPDHELTPQMLDMIVRRAGYGLRDGLPGGPSGYFPFTGTIKSLTITSGTALLGALNPNLSAGSQATFTPFTSGTYTIGLSSTDVLGSTGTTSQSFTTVGTVPLPAITGLPASSPEGTAVTLTASATETNATVAAEGFSYLWQATDADGASATGSGALSFNGTSQFVDLGNPGDLNFSGQITLDAWIMPESTGGLQDIIAHGYQTSPTNAEDFLRINGGYYQVGSWNGNNAFAQFAIPAGDIGQWVNLAGVYNGTAVDPLPRRGPGCHVGPDHAGRPAGQHHQLGHRRRGRRQPGGSSRGRSTTSASGTSASRRRASSPPWPGPDRVRIRTGRVLSLQRDQRQHGDRCHGEREQRHPGRHHLNNPAAEPSRVAGIVLSPSVTITPARAGSRPSPWRPSTRPGEAGW